jgi:4-hydroxy 2-oxovalerate aldolase
MSRSVTIFDCTLRDGSYAVNFRFTAEDTARICAALEGIGVRWIEVGHGVGLNGSGPKHGIAACSDEDYIRSAARSLKKARFGTFFIPGIADFRHLDSARECGMNMVRVGTNVTQSEQAEPYIKHAKKLGMYVSFNAMKSYLVGPDEFLQRAVAVASWGADSVYVVDSAGNMTPSEVRDYFRLLDNRVGIPTGFHGHNNLMLATGNSLAAMEHGATLIDCTLGGIGRGGGNTQLEVMVALCERAGFDTGIDLFAAQEIAERHIRPLLHDTASVSEIDLIMGHAGFHSSYYPRIAAAVKQYRVDPRRLIIEVSKLDRLNPSPELIESVAATLPRATRDQ